MLVDMHYDLALNPRGRQPVKECFAVLWGLVPAFRRSGKRKGMLLWQEAGKLKR